MHSTQIIDSMLHYQRVLPNHTTGCNRACDLPSLLVPVVKLQLLLFWIQGEAVYVVQTLMLYSIQWFDCSAGYFAVNGLNDEC